MSENEQDPNDSGHAFRYTPAGDSDRVLTCLYQDGRWNVWHGDTVHGTVRPVHFDTRGYGTSDEDRRRLCVDVGEEFGCIVEVT